MEVFFRLVTLQDIPPIKAMTQNIWEGDDYLPRSIEQWIRSSDAINVGMFKTNKRESKNIIGFARIQKYSPQLYWFEAGRVHPDYQKQGLGIKLLQHCIDIAHREGASKVQYDTWISRNHMGEPSYPQNHGSIALAKRFRFKLIQYVDVLELNKNKKTDFYTNPEIQTSTCREVDVQKFLAFLDHLNGKLLKYLNHGWNYIPYNAKIISQLGDHETWWRNQQALLHVIQSPKKPIGEAPPKGEIWIIPYGNPAWIVFLLKTFLNQISSNQLIHQIKVHCPPNISETLLTYQFTYIKNSTPSGVGLFEKKLKL
jgi:GNAT superfamily N-acetyltransferase